jgi:hypothetical protein
MNKRNIVLLSTLIFTLTGCYLPQNFDNQVKISRTGQYQVDVDTDVVGMQFIAAQNQAKAENKSLTAKDLKEILNACQNEFQQTVELDAKKGKNILSSKYLGECRGHLTLRYSGNIIKQKNRFSAGIGSNDSGFFIPLEINYDSKNKTITVISKTKSNKNENLGLLAGFALNGKLSVKTDGKVIMSNADSKPYWGLFGAYHWDIKDLTTPNATIKILTTGF